MARVGIYAVPGGLLRNSASYLCSDCNISFVKLRPSVHSNLVSSHVYQRAFSCIIRGKIPLERQACTERYVVSRPRTIKGRLRSFHTSVRCGRNCSRLQTIISAQYLVTQPSLVRHRMRGNMPIDSNLLPPTFNAGVLSSELMIIFSYSHADQAHMDSNN